MGAKASKLRRVKKSKSKVEKSKKCETKTDDSEMAPAKVGTLKDRFEAYRKSSLGIQRELSQPRVAFLSLFHVWRDWRVIPIDILYHSLFVFNADRRWIMTDSDDDEKESNTFVDWLYIDDEFLQLLACKEAQSRLVWINRNINDNDCSDNPTIDSSSNALSDSDFGSNQIESVTVDFESLHFTHVRDTSACVEWKGLSAWLQSHTDPISKTKYSGLILDMKWWKSRIAAEITNVALSCDIFDSATITVTDNIDNSNLNQWGDNTKLEYSNDLNAIESELSDFKFRFTPMSEILNQSNPHLIPMVTFDKHNWETKRNRILGLVSPPTVALIDTTADVGKPDSDLNTTQNRNNGIRVTIPVTIDGETGFVLIV